MAVLYIEATDDMLAAVNALNKTKNPAFANFFRNYIETTHNNDSWGADLWKPWGFTIENSEFKVVDEEKYAFFLLRWS